jgi:hypothetical protein
MKHSDFLLPLPHRSVSFAVRYRHAPWVSFPQPQDATAADQGLLTGSPTPDSLTEAAGPPRFLEDPIMNVPCSSTPAGPQRSTAAALRCCLPPFRTASTPTISSISRLNHTARPLTVYASQGGSPHHHARLASGWLAGLVRAGVATRWVLSKGFSYYILPSQASPGAPKNDRSRQNTSAQPHMEQRESPRLSSCSNHHFRQSARMCLPLANLTKSVGPMSTRPMRLSGRSPRRVKPAAVSPNVPLTNHDGLVPPLPGFRVHRLVQ